MNMRSFIAAAVSTVALVAGHWEQCNYVTTNNMKVPTGYCINAKLPQDSMSFKFVCSGNTATDTATLHAWQGLGCDSTNTSAANITDLSPDADFQCTGTAAVSDCAMVWRMYVNSTSLEQESECVMSDYYVEGAAIPQTCGEVYASSESTTIDSQVNQTGIGMVMGYAGYAAEFVSMDTNETLENNAITVMAECTDTTVALTYYASDDCTGESTEPYMVTDGECLTGTPIYTEVLKCPAELMPSSTDDLEDAASSPQIFTIAAVASLSVLFSVLA